MLSDHEKMLQELAFWAQRVIEIDPGDRILDIGCKDGKLLEFFSKNTVTVGVDPDRVAVYDGHCKSRLCAGVVTKQFTAQAVSRWQPFKVILNLQYDGIRGSLQNNQFWKDVKQLLHKDGVCVVHRNGDIMEWFYNYLLDEHKLEIVGADRGDYGTRLFIVHKGSQLNGQRLLPNKKAYLELQLTNLLHESRKTQALKEYWVGGEGNLPACPAGRENA